MVVDQLVEGPAWTGHELDESAGRYPLRVEAAVFNLVSRLLPSIITTTRQARMYALHALAWAEAEERGLDKENAEELVRRCEVVAAGIYYHHDPHRIELSSAHGEGRIPLFESEAGLDVARGAERGGLSSDGFADVYVGPCAGLGLLTQSSPPRRGERADLKALRAGVGDLLALADRDVIPIAELVSSAHLCLCSGFDAPDGLWLRRVLFEETPREDDRSRQLSTLMLIETLLDEETDDPDGAFRRQWGFGASPGDPEGDQRARVALAWRAAILRNYSVTAWRSLWSWLGEQLNQEPMTSEQLGDRLAEAVENQTVAELLAGLPQRTDHGELVPAEMEIDEEPWEPMQFLRQLALGAKRLEDLDEFTAAAFIGPNPTDLGPRWVAHLLEEAREDHLRAVCRDLAAILVRRAKRVALSKMQMHNGRPWLPTRLRDRDGLLSLHGREGAEGVALRIWSLSQVMSGVGLLRRRDDDVVEVTQAGRELYERLG